ncbi:phosphate-starvation-inducible PsiE family protein [Jannaschia ovalis]|uniref:Phosphate-starvation-inducible PsiE family protein n=1 Tax=Jannaschia ovalis TaxID=3038773 RepID=A0ABY8LDQ8_9RHOB|nr:phosphate-starvation-inducible PsiE family protein [Jannaschia sp. GRR-S6-38]WGH79452.1 phosphate-starvation-inducible PsiE family protein [Jannaschia sp. GRR-S6-38]
MIRFIDIAYERFAAAISTLLLAGMAIVILVATFSFLRLTGEVLTGAFAGTSYATLQRLFDGLLGAIIALELAHSVHLMVTGQRGFGQVRIVLVIGILAVVRKLIVVELEAVSGLLLLGLAAAVIALGGIYALLIWMDRDGKMPKD